MAHHDNRILFLFQKKPPKNQKNPLWNAKISVNQYAIYLAPQPMNILPVLVKCQAQWSLKIQISRISHIKAQDGVTYTQILKRYLISIGIKCLNTFEDLGFN